MWEWKNEIQVNWQNGKKKRFRIDYEDINAIGMLWVDIGFESKQVFLEDEKGQWKSNEMILDRKTIEWKKQSDFNKMMLKK